MRVTRENAPLAEGPSPFVRNMRRIDAWERNRMEAFFAGKDRDSIPLILEEEDWAPSIKETK